MKKLFKNTALFLSALFVIASTLYARPALAVTERIKMHKNQEGVIVPNCELKTLDNILNLDEEFILDPTNWGDLEEGLGDFNLDNCPGEILIGALATFIYAQNGYTKLTALGALTAAAEINYAKASAFYNNADFCGSNWFVFKKEDGVAPIFGSFPQSYSYRVEKCLFGTDEEKSENCFGDVESDSINDISNKIYREFLYQGMEYENDECKDNRPEAIKGHFSNYQRYYMRGRALPNFACDRFYGYNDDYNCCVEKSQKAVCISNDKWSNETTHVFCNESEECKIKSKSLATVQLDVFKVDSKNKLCVKTLNLCPFNHYLGGGNTQIKSSTDDDCIDEEGLATSCYGGIENFCQYYKHCVDVPTKPYKPTSAEISPYFDRACINFVGSSQNMESYGETGVFKTTVLRVTDYKGFTAPMVECVKETLENIFKNEAGHSRCASVLEEPNANEICESGAYFYRIGQDLGDLDSNKYKGAYTVMQERMKTIVRLFIIFAITIYGINVILTGGTDRKSIFILILKIGLISYLIFGNAWKDILFDGVYKTSTSIGNIVMKAGNLQAGGLISELDDNKLDGCQFDEAHNPNYANYGDRTYLEIFDTIDCKVMKYMGLSKTKVATIFLLALSTLFIGPVGIILFFISSLFGLLLIVFVVRVTYIFLSSLIAISVLVFMSPVILPMILFNKTKGFFDKSILYLLSFIIQPILLFAYTAIFLTLMDTVVTGDTTYSGNAPNKQLNCSERCETVWGDVLTDIDIDDCVEDNMQVIDPLENSLLCNLKELPQNLVAADKWTIVGFNVPGFEIRSGLVLSTLLVFIKAIFVLFILSSFLSIIPNIAANITGIDKSVIKEEENIPGALKIFKGVSGAMPVVGSAIPAAAKFHEKLKGNNRKSKK